MPSIDVVHQLAAHRFVMQLPEGEAFLSYAQHGQCLNFLHTYVPEAARSRGVAEQVVLAGFQYAQANGFKVIPTCPYVSHAFIRRHSEFQSLITSSC